MARIASLTLNEALQCGVDRRRWHGRREHSRCSHKRMAVMLMAGQEDVHVFYIRFDQTSVGQRWPRGCLDVVVKGVVLYSLSFTSQIVQTAPRMFSMRPKHLCKLKLCRTAFFQVGAFRLK